MSFRLSKIHRNRSRGGFIDDASVEVESADTSAERQKQYFDKKKNLIYKIKLACGFSPVDFDDPVKVNPKKLDIIKSDADRSIIITNLATIFDKFHNYLCFSDIDACIKAKFGNNVTNYRIVDSDLNVIRVPDESNANFRSFILDNRGNIHDFTGDVVPEIDSDYFIKEIPIDRENLPKREVNRLTRLNELIEMHNLVPIYSGDIEGTLDYNYKYPFALSAHKLRYGPISWNLYQHLFHVGANNTGYLINQNRNNPILQLIQSGQFGIFLKIFNDSFVPEELFDYVEDESVMTKKQYDYFIKNGCLYFDNTAYYQIYDELVNVAVKSRGENLTNRYVSIIEKYYRGEVHETSVDYTREFSKKEYIDPAYQDMVVEMFTQLYRKVEAVLITDNLVYLHNSAFFINFIENFNSKKKELRDKFVYFKSHFNKLIQNIEISRVAVREFLKIQYTWLLISMYSTDISFRIYYDTKNKFKFSKKRVNMHLLLYLRRVMYEISSFRKVPVSKLLYNMFGKDTMIDKMKSHNVYRRLPFCGLEYKDKEEVVSFRTCVETTILNILTYVLRQKDRPNQIDKDKLSKLFTGTKFHEDVVKFFESFGNEKMPGLKHCVEFSKLLQDIPVFRGNKNYYNIIRESGSYEVIGTYETIRAFIMYIVYGEVYKDPGVLKTRFEEWCRGNSCVVAEPGGVVVIDEFLTINTTNKHAEVVCRNFDASRYVWVMYTTSYNPNMQILSNSFFVIASAIERETDRIWPSPMILTYLILNYQTNFSRALKEIFPEKEDIPEKYVTFILKKLSTSFPKVMKILPSIYDPKTVALFKKKNYKKSSVNSFKYYAYFVFIRGENRDIVNLVDDVVRYNFDLKTVVKSIVDFQEPPKPDDLRNYLDRLLLIVTYYRFVKRGADFSIFNREKILDNRIIDVLKQITSEDVGFYVLLLSHVDRPTIMATVSDNKTLYAKLLLPYENFRSKTDTKSLIIKDLTRAVNTVFGDIVNKNSKLIGDVVSFLVDDKNIDATQSLINRIVRSEENTRN